MEMDMNSTMNELDAMAEGIKNLSIRTKNDEESSKAKQSQQFLQEAHGIVYGDRHEEYGDASVNFTNIARLWTAYVLMDKDCMKEVEETFKFTQEDVAFMMMLLKITRFNNKEETGEDSLRDIVGYTTILHRFKFLDE